MSGQLSAEMEGALEPLAVYLDSILQPFVLNIPQGFELLRDTKHFIQRFEGLTILDEAIIATLDVNSLYTLIPHNIICLVISTCLDKRPNMNPPTYFLMELLDLILDKNYFKFGDQFYCQVRGVAMGSAALLICLCVG